MFTVTVQCSQAPALKSAQIDQVHVSLPHAAKSKVILHVETLLGNKGKFGLHSALLTGPWIG